MVKRTWTALNGRLVFDVTINRDPSDGVPSVARVHCRPDPQDEHLVTIPENRPTHVEIKFRSGGYVYGYLQQRANVHIDGVENTGIFADIRFGITGRYDETHFEGLMVACPSRGGHAPSPPAPPEPLPPTPDDPTDPDSPLPIVSSQPGELFPYVYVRRWPRVTDEDLHYGFIQYSASSPPSSAFYEDLGAACQKGRYAAEALALSFIDGDAPYQGELVGSLRSLSGPVREFAHLAAKLQRLAPRPTKWALQLKERLDALLDRYHEPASYFRSADYRAVIDRIWQSYFALVVTLGYDGALLTDLSQSLWLSHVIDQAVTPDSADRVAVNELTHAQTVELANATVILPASVFPLPAAAPEQGSPPRGGDTGWIEPYAIGDLQMVRQRLVRYAAGEIARIENVMRGERKEISTRHTRRQVDFQEHRGGEEQTLQNDDADERTSLLEETRKLVAEKSVSNQYNNFQTSYGPPTQTTLNGTWTRTMQPGADPGTEDVTRFAREILNKTVSRINRTIGVVRASSTLNQVKDVVTSVIDNTSGHTNMRAVFRWLNKVYEACVVNYGNRLMMEFLVRRPAARFIAQEAALTEQRLARPVPPAQLGVHSFKDISPDHYATLCACYGVTELEPPPLAQKFVAATLRSGEEKQIAVPAGYCASDAFVVCVSTPPGLPAPVVLVGRQAFNSSSGSAPLQAYGEDSSIPVSVMDVDPTLSPPSDTQALVNVEVLCVPTGRVMDEWRIRIYSAIIRAYQQQAALYLSEAGAGGARRAVTRSPLSNRQIEQRELKNACMRLLLERMALLTGGGDVDRSGSPPSPWAVNEPRYIQFLDEVLEWTEMAYSFHTSPHDGLREVAEGSGASGAGDDALFTSFLQAEQARVLLPVQPGRVMAFLYFFSSGMLWDGNDRLVPVVGDDIALVNDLKHTALDKKTEKKVGRSWEIVVPTSMQILDETAAAPRGVGVAALPPEGS
jgi:hypothetical protein